VTSSLTLVYVDPFGGLKEDTCTVNRLRRAIHDNTCEILNLPVHGHVDGEVRMRPSVILTLHKNTSHKMNRAVHQTTGGKGRSRRAAHKDVKTKRTNPAVNEDIGNETKKHRMAQKDIGSEPRMHGAAHELVVAWYDGKQSITLETYISARVALADLFETGRRYHRTPRVPTPQNGGETDLR